MDSLQPFDPVSRHSAREDPGPKCIRSGGWRSSIISVVTWGGPGTVTAPPLRGCKGCMAAKGRRIAGGSAVLGLTVLVGAGFALRHRVLEEWYLTRLPSEDPEVRAAAIEGLREHGSMRCVPALIEQWMKEARLSVPVAGTAIEQVFNRIGPRAVADFLARLAPPAEIPSGLEKEALLRCLTDDRPRVRVLAALCLVQKDEDLAPTRALRAALLAGAREPQVPFRLPALQLIRWIGPQDLARASLVPLLDAPDLAAREFALEELREVVESCLVCLAESSIHLQVLSTFLGAIASLGPPEIALRSFFIRPLLKSEDPEVRRRAVALLAAMGKCSPRAAGDCVAVLLEDPVDYVRSEAATSLGAIGLATPDVVNALTDVIGRMDPAAHEEAVEALGALGP